MVQAGTSYLVVAAMAVAVALGGCSGQAKDTNQPLRWTKLPDGSWLSSSINDPKFDEVTRCWPAQGGFDCLNVFVGGGSVMPSRTISRDLPNQWPVDTNGYSCQYSPDSRLLYESITGKIANGSAATLKSHSVNQTVESDAVWGRGDVSAFMAANHVTGAPHFDCSFVVKLISEGSYLSIGTTSLSYRQFLGLDNPEKSIILRDANDPLSAIELAPKR